MRITRRIDTHEVCGMLDEGGAGALTPGPGEEIITLQGTSVAEVQEKARGAAGGPAGRVVVRDDGSVEAAPAAALSDTPLVDAVRSERIRKGQRLDAPLTLGELAAAERKARGV